MATDTIACGCFEVEAADVICTPYTEEVGIPMDRLGQM